MSDRDPTAIFCHPDDLTRVRAVLANAGFADRFAVAASDDVPAGTVVRLVATSRPPAGINPHEGDSEQWPS